MTPEKFNERMDDLYRKTLDGLRSETDHIVSSGAVDIDSAPDDYFLPMAVLAVALETHARQWAPSPHTPNHRAYRKLRSFFL